MHYIERVAIDFTRRHKMVCNFMFRYHRTSVTLSKHIDVAHGIGDTALIHFRISMRPIIYQKLQNFANINNLMVK